MFDRNSPLEQVARHFTDNYGTLRDFTDNEDLPKETRDEAMTLLNTVIGSDVPDDVDIRFEDLLNYGAELQAMNDYAQFTWFLYIEEAREQE